MYKKKIPIRTDCGLHVFKELLDGKWKLMLIYYISDGIKRPGALQKKISVDRRVDIPRKVRQCSALKYPIYSGA